MNQIPRIISKQIEEPFFSNASFMQTPLYKKQFILCRTKSNQPSVKSNAKRNHNAALEELADQMHSFGIKGSKNDRVLLDREINHDDSSSDHVRYSPGIMRYRKLLIFLVEFESLRFSSRKEVEEGEQIYHLLVWRSARQELVLI